MSESASNLKCCFFMPVDIGLILWGVLKLGFHVLFGVYRLMEAAFYVELNGSTNNFDWVIMTGFTASVLIRAINIAMAILLIIGTAKKNVKLLHVFTIGETIAIAANVCALFTGVLLDVWTMAKEADLPNWQKSWFSTMLNAVHLCLQIYVVKLVLQKEKEFNAEDSDIGD